MDEHTHGDRKKKLSHTKPTFDKITCGEKISLWAQIFYMIRIPILIGAAIFLFPLVVTLIAPTLFKGLYDFEQAPLNAFLNALWFSVFIFLFAWTTMISAKLVFFYGPERINSSSLLQEWFRERIRKPIIKWRLAFIIASLGAVFCLFGTFWINSPASLSSNYKWAWLFGGMAAGFLIAFGLLFIADAVQSYLYEPEDAESLKYMLFPFTTEFLQRRIDKTWKTTEAEAKNENNEKEASEDKKGQSNDVNWLKRIKNRLKANRTIGAGYFCYDKPGDPFQGGHSTAITLFIIFIIIYALFGFTWVVAARFNWDVSWSVPAIVYLPIVAAGLIWGLSALSFFLDAYRIPVILPVLLWLLLMSIFQGHYYRVIEHRDPGKISTLQDVSKPAGTDIQNPQENYMIVVAADGGGIQAAVWAAQVLTGIEEQCRKDNELQKDTKACANKIRLISSVSGGTVGTMYFVDAYSAADKGIVADDNKLKNIVTKTKHTSLSHVAWGIAYSDFLNSIFPFIPTDRGNQLEQAWLSNDHLNTDPPNEKNDDQKPLDKGLSTWTPGVRQGWRPAVIFNSAIVETGERFLMSTTELDEPNIGQTSQNQRSDEECQKLVDANFKKPDRGSRNFYEVFPCHDIPIVTAARLSSSFPYVTPAASTSLGEKFGNHYNRVHIVDGGYYDNYGIVSLSEWLNKTLSQDNPPTKIIVVQIRCNDTGYSKIQASDSWFYRLTDEGWFYQLTAPLSALYNVRVSGQRSRADMEFENLRERWKLKKNIDIQNVYFNFRLEDEINRKNGQPPAKDSYEPPLSWHFTDEEMKKVDTAWQMNINTPDTGWLQFRKVLNCYRKTNEPLVECPELKPADGK